MAYAVLLDLDFLNISLQNLNSHKLHVYCSCYLLQSINDIRECVHIPCFFNIILLDILISLFFKDKACEDKRGDCHEYGAGMCQEPYKTWARENCAQYCGFCATGKNFNFKPLFE